MKKHLPCPEWTTKLALRQEDFSSSEWSGFETHLRTCPGCLARRAEYGILLSEIQMLPPPAKQSVPDLSTYTEKWQGEEALGAYDDILCFNLQDTEASFKKASNLFSLSQYKEALDVGDQALELDPEKAEMWALKSKILVELGSTEEALTACEQALRLKPDEVTHVSMKANLLCALKRYEEAWIVVEHLLKLDAKSMEGWSIKAQVLQKLKRYEEAVQTCEYALTLPSSTGGIWKVKCRSLLALRKYKEALEACNHALEEKTEDVDLLHIQASGPFLLEREEGREVQEDLLQLDPNYVTDPTSIEGWADRVRLLALEDPQRYEKALDACNQALQLDPKRKKLWEMKGRILIALGRFDEALGVFKQSISLNLADAEEWRFLGCVYNRLGRYENARGAFKKAKELDPNRENVWGQTTASLLSI